MSDAGLQRRHLRRRFDAAATTFSDADFVHRATADGLLQRITPMTLQPKTVVDLGSAVGTGSRQLAKHYPKARVVSLDQSAAMLRQARASRRWWSRVREIQADATQLPFASGSVDIVFANLLLPWVDDPEQLFREVARVLRTDGLFAFATLGPASFVELREFWRQFDDYQHVNAFADMHNIGDALVRSGLRDPVVDVDPLAITYREPQSLFRDLTAAGARNSLRNRNPGLLGRQRFAALITALEALRVDGVLRVDLELVFGHAWGGGPPPVVGEYRLDPAKIGHRNKR